MKRISLSLVTALVFYSALQVQATVFLNEIFINPPSSSDSAREYIELMGNPGMKLDGYAIALVNGGARKIHPDSPIPPDCSDNPVIADFCRPETDEMFSLDGLRLGANGILVITNGAMLNYPTIVPDANQQRWNTLWNGGLDTTGNLQNDGSNTIVLIRRRPGTTQADPANPLGLRWGKDIDPDTEVIPTDPGFIQYGNGNFDRGDPNGVGGFTLDLKGASTPLDITDDLEIVDEISYEQDQGWEYDEDDRQVDVGSPSLGLPPRRVHTLDDPHGFTPDCLTRVDYRTRGVGYPPVAGATGQMGNGNNWQDTATEQWIRGESKTASGTGTTPPFFYNIAANPDPQAIIPYVTVPPPWLYDGQGQDFNLVTVNSYEIMAGRLNPLAIAFVPGDVDRDGDSDAEDIAKTAAVFGDSDWIFSNSFETSPQGDSGDPAAQTRPWDVDCTGDNGIEPTDLQWSLNFQGSTDGRILGVTYDSTTPSATGVVLNANTGVQITVSASASSACGRPLTGLINGDLVDVTVSSQVTAGANSTAGQENGVMQFVHDLAISNGGVVKVIGVTALGSFATTRGSIESLQGAGGDLGVKSINGYTTSFTQGVSGQVAMYKVTLQAVATGSATVNLGPASLPNFAAAAPGGVKLGHTRNATGPIAANIGNPAATVYPASGITLTVGTGTPLADIDNNGQINAADVTAFVNVLLDMPGDPGHVTRSDLNCDGLRNGRDIQPFVSAYLGV